MSADNSLGTTSDTMTARATLPSLAALTLGTVPFPNIHEAICLTDQACPLISTWPQMSVLNRREGMILQAMDGLPLLEIDPSFTSVQVKAGDRSQALTEFYEHFLAEDLDYFAVPLEAATAWGPWLERASKELATRPQFFKAQVVGPITFGQTIKTPEGKNILDDADLADTIVKGIGVKAAWLAGQIQKVGGRPIIFFDEPGLAGFGSAFSSLKAEQVSAMFNESAQIVRAHGPAVIGIHICGNTDWGLITELDLDILNFDAFGFLDQFVLYPRQVQAFLKRGGWIAWGIVPTLAYTGQETTAELASKLISGWDTLMASGVDPDLLRKQALISPSCGLGTVSADTARDILKLLPEVVSNLRTVLGRAAAE